MQSKSSFVAREFERSGPRTILQVSGSFFIQQLPALLDVTLKKRRAARRQVTLPLAEGRASRHGSCSGIGKSARAVRRR